MGGPPLLLLLCQGRWIDLDSSWYRVGASLSTFSPAAAVVSGMDFPDCDDDDEVDAEEDDLIGSGITKSKGDKVDQEENCCKGPGITKKVLVEKMVSVAECIDMLVQDAIPFSAHMHTAMHQAEAYKAFKGAAGTSSKRTLVSVWDFSENFRTIYQNEPQSAHFCYEQMTLLTMNCPYACECGNAQVDESVVFISDDTGHDAEFVQKCQDKWLEDTGISFDRHIRFSDGCSRHYRAVSLK